MDMIRYATLCLTAVATLTACGGGAANDAAPTSQSVASSATNESASQCSPATADVLKSAARRSYGDVYKVLCAGDWAKALIDTSAVTNANPPSIVLFHDDDGSGGGWRVVQ